MTLLLLGFPIVATLLLLSAFPRIKNSTLTGPWYWLLAAWWILPLGYWAGGWMMGGRASLEWAASTILFCPGVALMGAKRPQHRGWFFVVLSLWCLLTLPALLPLHTGLARLSSWLFMLFLGVLLAVPAINFLPTRHWFAACLVLVGHMLFWGPRVGFAVFGSLYLALFCWLIALACAVLRKPRGGGKREIDRRWLDFRDAFGALWALRAAETVNALAAMKKWDARLGWDGLTREDGSSLEDLPPELETALGQALHNVLRRFVA